MVHRTKVSDFFFKKIPNPPRNMHRRKPLSSGSRLPDWSKAERLHAVILNYRISFKQCSRPAPKVFRRRMYGLTLPSSRLPTPNSALAVTDRRFFQLPLALVLKRTRKGLARQQHAQTRPPSPIPLQIAPARNKVTNRRRGSSSSLQMETSARGVLGRAKPMQGICGRAFS